MVFEIVIAFSQIARNEKTLNLKMQLADEEGFGTDNQLYCFSEVTYKNWENWKKVRRS